MALGLILWGLWRGQGSTKELHYLKNWWPHPFITLYCRRELMWKISELIKADFCILNCVFLYAEARSEWLLVTTAASILLTCIHLDSTLTYLCALLFDVLYPTIRTSIRIFLSDSRLFSLSRLCERRVTFMYVHVIVCVTVYACAITPLYIYLTSKRDDLSCFVAFF